MLEGMYSMDDGKWHYSIPKGGDSLEVYAVSDYSGMISFEVVGISEEDLSLYDWSMDMSDVRVSSGEVSVEVVAYFAGVADAPWVWTSGESGGSDIYGLEDEDLVGVSVYVSPTDTDGSESLYLEVRSREVSLDDVKLSMGTGMDSLSLDMTKVDDDGFVYRSSNILESTYVYEDMDLMLRCEKDFGGIFEVDVVGISYEEELDVFSSWLGIATGSVAEGISRVSVYVEGVADGASLYVSDRSLTTFEDKAVDLYVASRLKDVDGSESLSVELRLGEGEVESVSFAGTEVYRDMNGVYDLSGVGGDVISGDVMFNGSLVVTPGKGYNGRIWFELAAISWESSIYGGDMMMNETSTVLSIMVNGIADEQVLELGNVEEFVYEDNGPISLEIASIWYEEGLEGSLKMWAMSEGISAVMYGDEILSVSREDVFSYAYDVYEVPSGLLEAGYGRLDVYLEEDYSGMIDMDLVLDSWNDETGIVSNTTSVSTSVYVVGVADVPLLEVSNDVLVGFEDESVQVSWDVLASDDKDGSEKVWLEL